MKNLLLLFLLLLAAPLTAELQAADRPAPRPTLTANQQQHRQLRAHQQGRWWQRLFAKKKNRRPATENERKSRFGTLSIFTFFGGLLLGLIVFEVFWLLGMIAALVLAIKGLSEDEVKWPAWVGLLLCVAVIVAIGAIVVSFASGY